MRLRTRLTLVLGVGASAMLALAAVVESALLARHARIHAVSSARAATDELQRSLQRHLTELTAAAAEGVAGATPEALAARLGPEVGVFVVEAGGELRCRSVGAAPSLQALEPWLSTSAFVTRHGAPMARAGLVQTPLGPGLAAAAPLGAHGSELVLVRAFDLGALSRGQRGVDVALLPALDAEVPDSDRLAFADLVRGQGEHRAQNEHGASIYSALNDADGRLTYVARVQAERADVSLQSVWLRDMSAWMLASGLLGILLLNRVLGTQVLAPLRVLEQHAARIGRSENGRIEIRLDRDDELGELARALDGMLRALDVARHRIAENARHVGMSDVSKGVVHSIGNVLTSVNVSTQFIVRELGAADVGDMRLLIDELRQHSDDLGTYVTKDPNGRFLLPFLDAMTSSLEDFQTRCRVELEAVEQGISHVVQLVRSIDRYALGASITESVDLAAVIEAALGIACLAHGGGREVEIVREFRLQEQPTLDRHKLTTILIHILTNALDSLMASPHAERRLEIATYDAGHGRFVIEITDSGKGISPAHLDTIFSPGFTTKSGAAGEGLHTAANLCRELGISIGAISEGPGTGATFKLRVPYVAPSAEDAPCEPPPILPAIARSTSGSPVQFDRRRSQRPGASVEAN